mmetsp:Transcript_48531/g.71973  ORF Transcript_48531/g.71973 Transcript_48531/m.71973 type:complete len:208 (-) Transcript_48531:1441-2064(-)
MNKVTHFLRDERHVFVENTPHIVRQFTSCRRKILECIPNTLGDLGDAAVLLPCFLQLVLVPRLLLLCLFLHTFQFRLDRAHCLANPLQLVIDASAFRFALCKFLLNGTDLGLSCCHFFVAGLNFCHEGAHVLHGGTVALRWSWRFSSLLHLGGGSFSNSDFFLQLRGFRFQFRNHRRVHFLRSFGRLGLDWSRKRFLLGAHFLELGC